MRITITFDRGVTGILFQVIITTPFGLTEEERKREEEMEGLDRGPLK